MFAFLSLASFAEHDNLQLYITSWKLHHFIILYSWIKILLYVSAFCVCSSVCGLTDGF